MAEYKELLEEKKQLERKIELTSLQTLVKCIAELARNSDSMEEFASNLDRLSDKFDEMINK